MPLFTRVRSWYQKAAAPCSLNQVAARLRGLRLPSSSCIRQGASTMPARRVSQRGVLAEGSRRSVDFQLRAMRPRVEHARQCAQRLRRRRPRQTVCGFQGFRKRFVSRARYAQQQVNVGRGRGPRNDAPRNSRQNPVRRGADERWFPRRARLGGCPSSTRSCSATTGRFPLSISRPGSACR